MGNSEKIRPIIKEDYKSVVRFLAKSTNGLFSEDFWLGRFEYWWDNNPAMDKDICRGWGLFDGRGDVYGFIGNIPIKYYIKGQVKTVCSATSWYVEDGYKQRSLEIFMPFFRQNAPLLLDTTPTEKVANILLRLGFRNLEHAWLKKDAIYPITLNEFWDFFVRRSSSNIILSFILKTAGIFLISLIKVYQEIKKLKLHATDQYNFREIKKFDDSYSSLWNEVKEKYDIVAVRDQIALNWFFFGSKDLLSSRRVIEIRNDKTLIGYAAVKIVNHSQTGKGYNYFEVVDMVINSDDYCAYVAVLRGLLKIAQNSEEKITLVKINPFDKKIEGCLKKYGFFMRPGTAKFLYKVSGKNTGRMDINEDSIQTGFYATPLDGDRCFFP